jgi:protein AbiQ
LKIINEVIEKASKIYDKQMSTNKVAKFCCDFKVLEAVCDTYMEDIDTSI